MVNLDWLIVGLAALALANYWFRRSVLYPPFLFCGMWLLDAILHRVQIVKVDPLHTITVEVVFAGAAIFSAGGLIAFFVPGRLVRTRLTVFGPPRRSAKWLQYLMLATLAVGILIGIRSAIALAGGIGGINGAFFAVARSALIQDVNAGRDTFSLSRYVGTWTIFVAALFLAHRVDRMAWCATAVAFIACIVSGGRTGLLSLFSAVTCILLVKSNRERFVAASRYARWPIAIFILLFGGMVFVNKGIDTGSTSVVGLAGQFLVEYIVGPLAALDRVLINMRDYSAASNHTFEFVLRIASALGVVNYTPPPPLDEWIYVPFPTNVYTYYRFIITDFGISGAMTLTGLAGFLHALLFRKAHSGSVIGLYLFSLTMYSVLIVIFDDACWRFGLYLSALVFAAVYSIVRSIPSEMFRPRQGGLSVHHQ